MAKRLLPLLVAGIALVLGLSVCNMPVSSETLPVVEEESQSEAPPTAAELTPPAEATSVPVPDVVYEGISFSYDSTLASQVVPATIPTSGTEGVPEWGIIPEHVQFSFLGYILAGTFHEPHVYVYPVSEFEAMSAIAGDVIADLQQTLADKPAAPDTLPFLPLFNAGQMMRAQVVYLDFQNGAGVRYLTQYSQASIPVNNHELFYTFQGLTSDGSYYISAILPVSNPILPADWESGIPDGDQAAFAEQFETYIADITQQLNIQAASSFTPELLLLDAMIQSLQVK